MDRLDGIAAFAAVAETGSFTAAAIRLRISKSAVSAQVQRLEERLGLALLRRTTRRVSLTEAGTTYQRHCLAILAEAEAAEQAAMALHREPRGTLRIAAPDTFGWMHVAPALSGFRERFPEVSIELRLDERHVNLLDEGLDLAIRIGTLPDSPLVVRRLAASRMLLVAAPAYLKRAGAPKSPADLDRHDCLCFPPLWRDGHWHLLAGQAEARVPATGTLVSNSAEVLRAAALQGLGIAMLPAWAVSEDIRGGRLKAVLPPWAPASGSIHAVYADERRMSAKVKAFVDHLARHIGRVPYWDR